MDERWEPLVHHTKAAFRGFRESLQPFFRRGVGLGEHGCHHRSLPASARTPVMSEPAIKRADREPLCLGSSTDRGHSTGPRVMKDALS